MASTVTPALSTARPLWLTVLRVALVAALAGGIVLYILYSFRWPLMVDSPIMHYVSYLIDHGMKPYQDITDNNMPGAYLTERWAMAVFGGTDLGWRVYEFVLLAVLAGSMIVIAWPYDWLAGFFAAALFILLHGTEGPKYAVEREEVMITLIMLGYAACFTSVRRHRPWLMLFFGFFASLAGSIKPTLAPLVLIVIALALRHLHRERRPMLPYLLWTLPGVILTVFAVLHFLLHYNAIGPFLYVLRVITPSYVALWHPGAAQMVLRSWPVSFLPLVPLALAALVLNRRWSWEQTALALGFFFGLASYFIQNKGFNHHRYTYLCCFLLLAGIEFTSLLRRSGWYRVAGAAALASTVFLLVPYYVHKQRGVIGNSAFTLQLEQDLRLLGGPERLQGKVQCFDLVFGCLNALYHDNIVQNSGFTGDLLFFSGSESAASRYYRDMFWRLARQDPAEVLVVSNEWFGQEPSFDKLQRWPQFVTYLNANYTEVLGRRFPSEDSRVPLPADNPHANAYRIYIRNSSPLMARAARLQDSSRPNARD